MNKRLVNKDFVFFSFVYCFAWFQNFQRRPMYQIVCILERASVAVHLTTGETNAACSSLQSVPKRGKTGGHFIILQFQAQVNVITNVPPVLPYQLIVRRVLLYHSLRFQFCLQSDCKNLSAKSIYFITYLHTLKETVF